MHNKKSVTLLIVCLVFAASALAEPAQRDDPPQESTREPDRTGMEHFLRSAPIVERTQVIDQGHGSYSAVLSDGREMKTAVIEATEPYVYMGYAFRDNFAYNVAAYRLDQMLNGDVVSPTVLRWLDGEWVSVTLIDSPNPSILRGDSNRVAVFRALVADSSGSFSGGFGETKELFGLQAAVPVDKQFQAALASLDHTRLMQEFGRLLTERQVRRLLARRDRILRLCRTAAESKGAGSN
jgi:hypothetical protein